MGRRSRSKGSGWRFPGPVLLLAFLAGAMTILFLVSREHISTPRGSDNEATVFSVAEHLDHLTAVLGPLAQWEQQCEGDPAHWQGRIPSGESMVRWNTRASAAIEALGLEVLEGNEELIKRRNRSPLQRLKMQIGVSGETLATILVETARSTDLPPAF